MSEQRLVVVFAGHPGSGKTTAARHSEQYGLGYYCPGDLIRAEARGRNKPPSRAAGIVLLHEMEAAQGLDVLMRPVLTSPGDMVVDGLRRIHDLRLLRSKLNGNCLRLIAITSTMEDCHNRAMASSERNGQDSPDFQTFQADCTAEAWNNDPLKPSVDQVMAQADFIVPNNGSLPDFLRSIDTVMQAVRREHASQQM